MLVLDRSGCPTFGLCHSSHRNSWLCTCVGLKPTVDCLLLHEYFKHQYPNGGAQQWMQVEEYANQPFIKEHKSFEYFSKKEKKIDNKNILVKLGPFFPQLLDVSRLPHLFAHVEPNLLSIMRRMLMTDGQVVYTVTIDIACIFNTYGPQMCLDDGRVDYHLLPKVVLVPPPSGRGERVYILSPTYPTPIGPDIGFLEIHLLKEPHKICWVLYE
nr:hypothetical protein [Tanacetum cinerariifolium]